MARPARAFGKANYRSEYDSIHSLDAYIGDYQVMYTPGSSPPGPARRKPSNRFGATRNTTGTHSIIIPSNIPNTSQILPNKGTLPDVNVHYHIPADEKQIAASLREVQHRLDEAMIRINDLEQERDDARRDLELMRAATRKSTTPAKRRERAVRVEEELFDLSRSESPEKSPIRPAPSKRVSIGKTTKGQTENNARVIEPEVAQQVDAMSPEVNRRVKNTAVSLSRDFAASSRRSGRRSLVQQDTEDSMLQEPTAASNTSRRRQRHSLDDNMTSAYLLPDIEEAMKQQGHKQQARKSAMTREAQGVLHDHDPEHIEDCQVCQRLLTRKNTHDRHMTKHADAEPDYTAQVTALMKDIAFEDTTMRPKIAPSQALDHLKKLLQDQYDKAKERHGAKWTQYDSIDAPHHSKKHGSVAEEMGYWAKKMEECRVNLDQLRDVEEGMRRGDEL